MKLKGLKIEPQERENAVILQLEGEIRTDIYSEFLDFCKTRAQQTSVILDFTNLKYMSSAGVGALFNIDKVARENSHKLVMFGMNESVKKIIDLTKLTNTFVMAANMDEALEQVRK